METELEFQKREERLDEVPIGRLVLPRLTGLVSAYNNLFQAGDGGFQTVLIGAFDNLLKTSSSVSLRINHVAELSVPGTVGLFTNWEGLCFEALLDDSRISRDLIFAIRHGYLTGISPAWTYRAEDRNFSDGEKYEKINHIFKIDEISFCTNPAQNETRAGFAGKARLSAPSRFGPLLSSEANRLQIFIDHVESEANKIRPRPFSQPKPAALKIKIKSKSATVFAVPAQSAWQRVNCKAF